MTAATIAPGEMKQLERQHTPYDGIAKWAGVGTVRGPLTPPPYRPKQAFLRFVQICHNRGGFHFDRQGKWESLSGSDSDRTPGSG